MGFLVINKCSDYNENIGEIDTIAAVTEAQDTLIDLIHGCHFIFFSISLTINIHISWSRIENSCTLLKSVYVNGKIWLVF